MNINKQIKAREVLVISGEKKLGIMPTYTAIDFADRAGLDLVEVSPNAKPPVCKIMDYGKFLYEQKKKQVKTLQKVTKEMKITPNTSEHDLGWMAKQIRGFLDSKYSVIIKVVMRGRQNVHPDICFSQINKLCENIGTFKVEKESKQEGKIVSRTIYDN